MRNAHIHARRGSAMVMSSVLIVVLGGLAVTLTDATVSSLKAEQRRSADLALAMAAESAANVALDHLQNNSDLLRTDLASDQRKAVLPGIDDLEAGASASELTGAGGMGIARSDGAALGARWCYIGPRAVRKTYVDGLPRLEVVPIGTPESSTQDVYFIRAWATQGSDRDVMTWRSRRVEVLFVPYPQNVFVRAMFAHKGYDFQGDAKTDSWDSSAGAYDPANPGRHGDLGSEGDIYVQKPTNVQGDVDDFISYPLPPVVYDESIALQADPILDADTTLLAGTYRYSAIDLHEPDQLTISGKVTIYVDGPVSLTGGKNSNPLKYADAASSLTIIQNDFDPADPRWSTIDNGIDAVNGNDAIGDPLKPSRFVYVSAATSELTMNGNGEFGGVLYAPNATMKFNGTFDFYGAVISDAFASKALSGDDEQGRVNGTFSFHYDEQLANLRLPLPARLGVVGWYTTNPVAGAP